MYNRFFEILLWDCKSASERHNKPQTVSVGAHRHMGTASEEDVLFDDVILSAAKDLRFVRSAANLSEIR
jgi:hypothetical protein